MVWVTFLFPAMTGRLVRVDGRMDGAKYKAIPEGKPI